jgi:hypothetical protein
MSLPLLFLLLIGIGVYWTMTQILPERRRGQLLRSSLAEGLLEAINTKRHEDGLPLLELDEDLLHVAESKATHQFLTGIDEEGWEYPSSYAGMLGRSLLLEVLLIGPAHRMGEKLSRQAELMEGDWITCGIGVAGGRSEQIVVAMVLCREAWEPMTAMPERRSLLERLALGK